MLWGHAAVRKEREEERLKEEVKAQEALRARQQKRGSGVGRVGQAQQDTDDDGGVHVVVKKTKGKKKKKKAKNGRWRLVCCFGKKINISNRNALDDSDDDD